mgnify:FL=1
MNDLIKGTQKEFLVTGRKIEKVKHLKFEGNIQLFESISGLLKII